MIDEAVVEIVSDRDSRDQFGKAVLYRNGRPRRRMVVLVCIAVTVVVLVPALLVGPPDTEAMLNSQDLFTIPSVGAEAAKVDLPPYSRTEDLDAHEAADRARKRVPGPKGPPLKLAGPQLVARPRGVKIPPGIIVKAELRSGASNGIVKAELKEPVVVDGETLVEAGTMAFGQGSSTDNRLFIKFTKLVYSDGAIDKIAAQAADTDDKTPGIKGSKVGYQALRLATGIGLNFAGGMAQGLQDTQGQSGAVVAKPTMKNALLNGAASAALDQSKEMMSSLRSEPPIIEVPDGMPIYMIFDGED